MTHYPKSIHALLDAVALAKRDPSIKFRVPGDWTIDGHAVLTMWNRGITAKCNRGLPTSSDERYLNLKLDARTINDYYGHRIRHTGSLGLLRDIRMQRKYPHINNQPRDN